MLTATPVYLRRGTSEEFDGLDDMLRSSIDAIPAIVPIVWRMSRFLAHGPWHDRISKVAWSHRTMTLESPRERCPVPSFSRIFGLIFLGRDIFEE